jgi:hypothetical protein
MPSSEDVATDVSYSLGKCSIFFIDEATRDRLQLFRLLFRSASANPLPMNNTIQNVPQWGTIQSICVFVK